MRLFAAVVLGAVMSGVAPAHACKCDGAAGERGPTLGAPRAFSGKVVEVKAPKEQQGPAYDAPDETIVFEVTRWLRGGNAKRVEVRQETGTKCASHFQVGEEWLVFLWKEDSVNMCSTSRVAAARTGGTKAPR